MNVQKLIAYFSLAIIFSLGIAVAQKPDKAGAIEFSCVLWNGELEQELFFRNGREFLPVVPFKTSRSKTHSLVASESFELYVKSDEEAVDPYKLVGKVAIPSGVKQVLFLLLMNEKEELNIKILAVDDSIEGFPAGTFRFVNFSKRSLVVDFAADSKKIKPKGMTIMKPRADNNGGLTPFIVRSNKGEIIFQTRLFSQTNNREMVFITDPEKRGALPGVRFLPQTLPDAPPKGAN